MRSLVTLIRKAFTCSTIPGTQKMFFSRAFSERHFLFGRQRGYRPRFQLAAAGLEAQQLGGRDACCRLHLRWAHPARYNSFDMILVVVVVGGVMDGGGCYGWLVW